MENLEIYVNSINEIFSYLDTLDQNLESEDNSLNIKNLNEYKELAISFAKLVGGNINNNDNTNTNVNANTDTANENIESDESSLMPENNDIELDDDSLEEGDSNDW